MSAAVPHLPPAAPARAARGDSPWIRRWSGSGVTSRATLVCLPHAGGSATFYRPWAALLPPEVELLALQYPAREERVEDPGITGMSELVTAVADAVLPLLDRPYALFGHSMGSAVAWELAHELRRRGAPGPRRLFASGRAAPGTAVTGQLHRQSDDVLGAELLRLGGTSGEILDDPGLRALVLTAVRHDYRIIETHRPAERPPLACPVHVLTGAADPELGEERGRDRAGGWADLTTARTEVRVFPGDHFYLTPRRREVVATVLRRMDPSLATGARTWPSTP
ncbi:thioesterase II family protein [Streptomyces griseoaurantiacus]|uniref:Surfactin synthase thioesterase subunit n=1 Tax=Streptomyces griseoaurantiacus TaxID=68213 RepID=A0A1G7E3V1_9ACTN|nr:alpha/beta fold hydrolase [Streptomyces jietaisiensis]SDE58341.1 Surfactin synthase thioesterase subunit [Streptomyces jietaisiensis]